MAYRIHLFGASGFGAITLGLALVKRLGIDTLDGHSCQCTRKQAQIHSV